MATDRNRFDRHHATVALEAVQAARYALRRLYLGDKAGDEIAVAETAVPLEHADLSSHLHTAYEQLLAALDVWPAWEDQAIGFEADGPIRLKSCPELCKPAAP